MGTIGAATHSMGGRGMATALLAPVNRPEQLIVFFEALECISQKFPSSESHTIACSLFIRCFEGQPGLHLPLKGPPPPF